MKATDLIMSNLKAMGANPTIKISKDSKNIEIKINAPRAKREEEKEV